MSFTVYLTLDGMEVVRSYLIQAEARLPVMAHALCVLAYLLTAAALQLLFGKFYTYFNVKWVYLSTIVVFELGSLICGVAQNSVTLIIGRAVAGLGSAGLMSGSLLILAHSVPLAKRPIYSGMIGGLYGVASVAGPLLGGVFADKAVRTMPYILPTQQDAKLTRLYFRRGGGASS